MEWVKLIGYGIGAWLMYHGLFGLVEGAILAWRRRRKRREQPAKAAPSGKIARSLEVKLDNGRDVQVYCVLDASDEARLEYIMQDVGSFLAEERARLTHRREKAN